MRQRINKDFFIGDLSRFGLRQSGTGAFRILSPIAAALVCKGFSSVKQALSAAIELGEIAQGVRDPEALARASRIIHDLPGDAKRAAVGDYYLALALNRSGRSAYPRANKILAEVASRGPALFRAKALVALGTNSLIMGDAETAVSAHADAIKIAGNSGHAGLHPLCCIKILSAARMTERGDYKAALQTLRLLSPLIRQLGRDYLPLVHLYTNNLTVALADNGLIDEARSFSKVLLASPFLEVHPEWQKTCADLVIRSYKHAPAVFHTSPPAANHDPVPHNVLVLPLKRDTSLSPATRLLDTTPARRAKVLHLDAWKKKNTPKAANAAPRLRLFREQIPMMTTQQKQAAILRLILSDDVTDPQLNRVLESMITDDVSHPSV